MRILIFAAFYPPDAGGYAVNVRALAQGMAELGHGVTVVACGRTAERCRDNRVCVYTLPSFQILSGRYPAMKPSGEAADMLLSLSKQHFDIVNTQTRFYPITLLGMLFARSIRAALVHTERGATHNLAFKGILGLASQTYDHTVGMAVMKAADKVIGVSDGACEFARHLGAWNPVTVHNGIAPEWFKVDGNRDRDPHSIIFTGRLIPAKGVADLLDAFVAVKAVMPSVRLTVVGDGPCREELEARHVDGVAFIGQRSREDVAKLLREHSVFVNPSYSEGLPTSVLEAMAAGMSVIATDVGGTRELITHGETGYLVSPGKVSQLAGAMLRALSNANGVGKMAEKIAAEFTQQACTEKTLAVYKDALGV